MIIIIGVKERYVDPVVVSKSKLKKFVRNISQNKFIGKEVEIIESKNKDLVGIKGKIVDETKNMFEIETKKDTRPSGNKKSAKESL